MLDSKFVDNPALHRFELHDASGTAFLVYEKLQNSMRLIHTEVPFALRGKGVGSRLVEEVLKWAADNNVKVNPVCPFVIDYIKDHPEHLEKVE